MIIAVDQEIVCWQEAFADLGEVHPFSGRALKPGDLKNADALIVRTVTQVDASLLENSSVRFVASATAGTDHVDQSYLAKRGIHFSYAAGCNANAVSEYIATVLHLIAARRGWDLKSKSLAIIGVGNVGSRVETKARALGMDVLLCDPPLRDSTGDPRYLQFSEVLGSDILTFHVPLASTGEYPTYHMLDRAVMARLSPKQYVINSARGSVVDNDDLKIALQEGGIEGAVLDVWEGEPCINHLLLQLVDIGTPHIAGLAADSKIRATEMVRQDLCRFINKPSSWDSRGKYPQSKNIFPEEGSTGIDAVLSVLGQILDVMEYDAGLRALEFLESARASAGFDQLRSRPVGRPEFRHFIVNLREPEPDLIATFVALGFQVANSHTF